MSGHRRMRRPRFAGCAPSPEVSAFRLQSLVPRGVSRRPPGVGCQLTPGAPLACPSPEDRRRASASALHLPCSGLPLVDGQCRPAVGSGALAAQASPSGGSLPIAMHRVPSLFREPYPMPQEIKGALRPVLTRSLRFASGCGFRSGP